MMRAALSLACVFIVVGLMTLGGTSKAHAGGCNAASVFLRGDWGQARFNVDVVDTHETRAVGLMHRKSLPKSSGMLFVYEREQALSFWMRNTLIPLDMLFIDRTGTVKHIHENAIPHDETPIPGGIALAVLEINGGMVKALGIQTGSQMRHPAFEQATAAWAC